jgi:hypothetical protein
VLGAVGAVAEGQPAGAGAAAAAAKQLLRLRQRGCGDAAARLLVQQPGRLGPWPGQPGVAGCCQLGGQLWLGACQAGAAAGLPEGLRRLERREGEPVVEVVLLEVAERQQLEAGEQRGVRLRGAAADVAPDPRGR